jgi:hypothetical protein
VTVKGSLRWKYDTPVTILKTENLQINSTVEGFLIQSAVYTLLFNDLVTCLTMLREINF